MSKQKINKYALVKSYREKIENEWLDYAQDEIRKAIYEDCKIDISITDVRNCMSKENMKRGVNIKKKSAKEWNKLFGLNNGKW